MRAIYRWLVSLTGISIATTVAFQWLDRPIALWVHNQLRHPNYQIFEQLTHIPDPLFSLAVMVFVGLGLWVLTGRQLSTHQAAVLLCSLSLLFTEATKNQLKFIFGRTWPETWIQDNPSFIRDGAYGFNFMHAGPTFQSFPSGHTAAIGAVISVLWIWYPRLRGLWVLALLAVGIGLVGANYHFLSDVIAGGFVGISTGWMAMAIWETRVQPVSGSRIS
jgi:membrane-associated phospholipid phosphatase